MNRASSSLIKDLAADLKPVRAFRARDGLLLTGAAVVISLLIVALIHGFWHGAIEGTASPFFYLGNGLLTIFGFACAASVVRMASPSVGNNYSGAYWMLAMLGVLPVVALTGIGTGDHAHDIFKDPYGLECALHGSAVALVTAVAFTGWLRRGAPVDANRAGLLTGLASGALGGAAYGLSCPLDTLGHVAIWHVLPVAIAGFLGRMVLPRLLRW
ncbi:MAG: DUF1109 domain-containing protein [Erythrobacter sp.]